MSKGRFSIKPVYILGGAALLIALLSKRNNTGQNQKGGLTRGIRNNNPGNIKINPANNWQGRIPLNENTDGVFEQFVSMEYGIRALIKVLQSYCLGPVPSLQTCTIESIISRFAPPNENNTQAYIDTVTQLTGLNPYAPLDLSDPEQMAALVLPIATIESQYVIPRQQYEQAVMLV